MRARVSLLPSPHTHTHIHNHFMALWTLSRTTRVSQYHNKHSLTHTYHGQQSSLICFLHLLQSMASPPCSIYVPNSLFSQSLQVFFGLPLGLAPSTSYSIHFFSHSCLLFAAHTHTLATCFAVVPRLCRLLPVSLSQTFTWNSIL